MKTFKEYQEAIEKEFKDTILSTPFGVIVNGVIGSCGATGSASIYQPYQPMYGATGSVGSVGMVGATGPAGITKQDYREIRIDEILSDDKKIDDILFGSK